MTPPSFFIELIRDKKIGAEKTDGNGWHPLHHENKETFGVEDLQQLAKKHALMLQTLEKNRRREFKVIRLTVREKRPKVTNNFERIGYHFMLS